MSKRDNTVHLYEGESKIYLFSFYIFYLHCFPLWSWISIPHRCIICLCVNPKQYHLSFPVKWGFDFENFLRQTLFDFPHVRFKLGIAVSWGESQLETPNKPIAWWVMWLCCPVVGVVLIFSVWHWTVLHHVLQPNLWVPAVSWNIWWTSSTSNHCRTDSESR